MGTTASAQFSQLPWTLVGDPDGVGTLTADTMHVTGADGVFCSGSTPGKTWFEATAPFDGTVNVYVVFDNQDIEIPWWHVEHPIFVRNGVSSIIGLDDSFDFEGEFSFVVSAGDTFGFGIWSLDCQFGPGVIDLSQFEYVPDGWGDPGFALPGSPGPPLLQGFGTLAPGNLMKVQLDFALPNSSAMLVVGFSALVAPFKGGVLVPDPAVAGALLPFTVGPGGRIVLVANWPVGVPPGLLLWLQYWIADPAGPAGFSASNAVVIQTQ